MNCKFFFALVIIRGEKNFGLRGLIFGFRVCSKGNWRLII